RELFGFVRSPYSGLPRSHADFLEGRLRGRGIRTPERVESEVVKLRGQPLVFLDRLRAAPSSLAAVRELAATMLRSAYGLESPPAPAPRAGSTSYGRRRTTTARHARRVPSGTTCRLSSGRRTSRVGRGAARSPSSSGRSRRRRASESACAPCRGYRRPTVTRPK